jgi:hypothetical protein
MTQGSKPVDIVAISHLDKCEILKCCSKNHGMKISA